MLIAEIGNNHFGDFKKAKQMIKIARWSGADAIKLQAFKAKDLGHCSMPADFYKQCEFNLDQYQELISYGWDLGLPVFYSIFSEELKCLHLNQGLQKFSAFHTEDRLMDFASLDSKTCFFSFSSSKNLPKLKRAIPMYASPYLPDNLSLVELDRIGTFYNRPAGYSDHTVGIEKCIEAKKMYGAQVIEKHFTLKKNQVAYGQTFRDTVHAADPNELEELAKGIG